MKSLRTVGFVALCVFCLGLGFGWLGARYSYTILPEKKAKEEAKKQQEDLNKMLRHGKLVSVEPDVLVIKVVKGGGDIGKTITVRSSEYTSIQVGMGFINQPGQKTNLTKWFKAGDFVDMIVKDNQVLSLHRDFRPGENSAPAVGGQVYEPEKLKVRLAPNLTPQG